MTKKSKGIKLGINKTILLVMVVLSGSLVASSHQLKRGLHRPLSKAQEGPAQEDVPTDVEEDDDDIPLFRPPTSRRKLPRLPVRENREKRSIYLAMITETVTSRIRLEGGDSIVVEEEQEILVELPEMEAREAIERRLERLLGN